MASSPATDLIGIELGTDPSLSPPAPSSDSSSSSSSGGGASPPSSDSDPSSSSPTPPVASLPPPEESPPQSPPPSSQSPPSTSGPPPSSPPPTVKSPPPTVKSPPTSSSPPPSPPSESQQSPPVSSSPPPSPPSPSTSTPTPTTTSPPSNNSPSPPVPSPPLPTTTTPSTTNPSQQIPTYFPPPQSENSGGQTPYGSAGILSPPSSTSNPDTSAPPRHSSGTTRPTGSSSPSTESGPKDKSGLIIGVISGGILILALVIVCLLCSKKKKKQPYYTGPGHPQKGGDQYWDGGKQNDHVVKLPTPPPGTNWGPPPGSNPSNNFGPPYSGQHQPGYDPPSSNTGGMMGGYNQSQFTYEELAAATGGFTQTNVLGQGGFGYVHKGVLPTGREVAVKCLKSGSGQGEREFQAEVEIISRVHHRHLVSLVGYCISDKQRMLVYEYVPNKTMEFHLHAEGQPVMEWSTRMRIALGSAKGLAYLHEDCNPRIIHRDIKSANILLDDNYEAMVADFGLAKLTTDNLTHVSTRVMGTFGYMAPEYASSGKLTEKSDVFSYGIMLLELITGRKPIDTTNRTMEDGLVDWVRPLIPEALEKDDFSKIVDPRLEESYDHQEMARMIACASACIRHSARRRPKMSQIIRTLDGNSSLEDLNEVPRKSPSNISTINRGNDTIAYDTGMYNADMMKFRKMVLNSEEHNPSEDGATSEYGLNPSESSSDEFASKQQQRQQNPY